MSRRVISLGSVLAMNTSFLIRMEEHVNQEHCLVP